jgi:hypothetical protein
MLKNILLFLILVFASVPFAAMSQIQPQQSNEPYLVELKVFEIFKVCKSGEVVCPVKFPYCDDSNVVVVVDTPDGVGFKGIFPGTTLCSLQSANFLLRVFRIKVK